MTKPTEETQPVPRVSTETGASAPAASDQKPKLVDGVRLIGEYEGSGFKEPPFFVRRADGQVIQVTHLLYVVAEAVDGARTGDEIAAYASDRYGKKVSAENVGTLLDKHLRPAGIVTMPDGSVPKLTKSDPLLGLKFQKTLVGDRAVNVLATLMKPLFFPPIVVAVLGALVALDVWYFGSHGFGQEIRQTVYQPAVMLLIYALLVLSVAWHEIGHATACRYGGGTPGAIGFGIYLVWPAFYTDVTDAYTLAKKDRVRTDLGGVYFNAIFALAIAGVYFLTGYEPLLMLVLIQHLLAFYQFLPFLRLDGYYVVADITGIPDLFGRIKPTLKSLVPNREVPREVDELKPWARAVVTAWVLMVVPVLLFLFTMMVISLPRVAATAWDSFFVQWGELTSALREGNAVKVTAGAIQSGMLVLPVGGMTFTFSRVSARIARGAHRITEGRPIGRGLIYAIGAGSIGLAAFVLWPNGDYRPIEPGHRWTVVSAARAFTEIPSGRPGLIEPSTGGGTGTTTEDVDDPAPADEETDTEENTTEGSEETPVPEETATEEEEATPAPEEPTPEATP